MKKLLLLLAIMAMFTINLQAQEFSFGAKLSGALTSFSITGDNAYVSTINEGSKGRMGFQIGGIAKISFSEKFAVAPELFFGTAGNNYHTVISDYGMTVVQDSEVSMSYINLSLKPRYYFTESLSIEAGPTLGLLLSANTKYTAVMKNDSGDVIDESSDDADAKENFQSTSLGLGVGANYEMENGLFFSVRYLYGLSDIDKGDDTATFNRGFSIGVGYFFGQN